jgi:hexosaminidase
VTAAGHKALLSSCWYLDDLGLSWIDMHGCEPQNFGGTPQQLKLVQGGEACMWGEGVDQSNVVARVFPRASGAAERLWSDAAAITDVQEAARRLEEFRCRMRRRGVNAEPPNTGAFCPGETF